jgi:hypothetical protein
MNILTTFDLSKELEKRYKDSKEKEKRVYEIEEELKAARQEHAESMHNLSKLYIYEAKAKRDNENSYFIWKETNGTRWEGNGKDYKNIFWEFEIPTLTLKIRLKKRHDLKVWKYEVHVSGYKIHFENFEFRNMHERSLRNSWYNNHLNFLMELYPESLLSQKFKTEEEALSSVEKWKQKLENRLSYEINFDHHQYSQAIQKYNKAIRVELNHESAKIFYEKLDEQGLIYSKDDYWHVEITGEKAKEVIYEFKKEMNFTILAG